MADSEARRVRAAADMQGYIAARLDGLTQVALEAGYAPGIAEQMAAHAVEVSKNMPFTPESILHNTISAQRLESRLAWSDLISTRSPQPGMLRRAWQFARRVLSGR